MWTCPSCMAMPVSSARNLSEARLDGACRRNLAARAEELNRYSPESARFTKAVRFQVWLDVKAALAGPARQAASTRPGQTIFVWSEGAPFRRPRELGRLPPMAGLVWGTTWALP